MIGRAYLGSQVDKLRIYIHTDRRWTGLRGAMNQLDTGQREEKRKRTVKESAKKSRYHFQGKQHRNDEQEEDRKLYMYFLKKAFNIRGPGEQLGGFCELEEQKEHMRVATFQDLTL